MNILIYSSLWSPSVGGVQSVTNTLARGLAEWNEGDSREVKVTVATPSPTSGSRNANADGSLRVVGDAGFFRICRLVWRSDIIHLAGPALLPLLLAWFFSKKAVILHHGYQAVCPDGSLVHFVDQRVCCNSFASGKVSDCVRCRVANVGWLRGLISVALAYPRLWLCRRVAANIGVSKHVSAQIGLPRTSTIYSAPANPIVSPLVEFPRPEPIANFYLDSDAPLLAFVGRLTNEKGVTTLLHAAAALAAEDVEFRVRIIGDGPERARLAILAWSLRLRDRVEFTGTLEGAALEAAVLGAVAVVLPSVAVEAAGLVAIEQMMRGRVVIASDTGGLGEIVGEAGLKFPPGDIEALTDCLRRVLGDPKLCMTLGRAARSRALEHFTQERMVEEHMKLYSQILETSVRARPPMRAPSQANQRIALASRRKRAS
jgi:glycosyltransferase involved in cell wall biosynthesis